LKLYLHDVIDALATLVTLLQSKAISCDKTALM